MDFLSDSLADSFSMGNIAAGLIFGVIGFWMVGQGKKRGNVQVALIGLAMCIFPYFVSSVLMNWSIGIGLSYWAYVIWEQ